MIHQYKLGGYPIVLDVCSGSVHVVDEVAYDIIAMFESADRDTILRSMAEKYAGREDITADDLEPYTEIIHGDVSVPALPMAEARELAAINESKKCITIYERGSQFELLCRLPSSFMWVSPMPEEVLQRFGLVQKQCRVEGIRFRDVLIFRQEYSLNRKEKLFLEKLQETIDAVRVEPQA